MRISHRQYISAVLCSSHLITAKTSLLQYLSLVFGSLYGTGKPVILRYGFRCTRRKFCALSMFVYVATGPPPIPPAMPDGRPGILARLTLSVAPPPSPGWWMLLGLRRRRCSPPSFSPARVGLSSALLALYSTPFLCPFQFLLTRKHPV